MKKRYVALHSIGWDGVDYKPGSVLELDPKEQASEIQRLLNLNAIMPEQQFLEQQRILKQNGVNR